MPYIKTTDQTYGHSYEYVCSEYPSVSVALGLSHEIYEWYDDVVKPESQNDQVVEEEYPRLVDGRLEQNWVVKNIPPELYASKLSELKLKKKIKINEWRLIANSSSFTHAGKTIACDNLSWRDITGTNDEINNLGSLPTVWPGGWKTMDNDYVPISTVEEWKSFYSSMYNRGINNFIKAQQLKTAVETATTFAEVENVVW